MTNPTPEVTSRHARYCADLLRLNNTDGERARLLRESIAFLEWEYPQLERQRISMMQDAILQED